MRPRTRRKERGVTLLELMIAVALFALVLGAAAQALISYHGVVDMQRQRNEAAQHCRSVLSDIRDVRAANPNNFPGAITARWPNGAVVNGVASLPQEQVTVRYVNLAANPLEVIVMSTWRDMHNRPMTFSLTTLLTDQ